MLEGFFTPRSFDQERFRGLVDFSGLEPSPQISGMQVDRPLCHRQDRINTVTTHSESMYLVSHQDVHTP